MTKIETNRPGESSTIELKNSLSPLITSSQKINVSLTGRTSLSRGW